MHTSQRGAAFIAAHEGVVTKAYRDTGGVWTIGVGHTASAGPPKPSAGMRISREEAFLILASDLAEFEKRVAEALPGVAQPVFDGAVSFDFNTGAINRASWVRYFRSGATGRARSGLMQWTKAGGRTVAGLVKRREAEARLIFDGDYGGAKAGEGSPDGAEIRACQKALATLGFYQGAIDGLAGPATRAAVLAYQKTHPDLVADGIAGPATQASLSREIAARRTAGQAAGAAAGGAAAATVAVGEAGAAHPLLWGLVIGAALLVSLGAIIALRYRGEFRRMIGQSKRSAT